MVILIISFLAALGILLGIGAAFYVRYLYFNHLLSKARKEVKNHDVDTDVIVVGGGILGSALAAVLARDGRRVTVIDKSPSPPRKFSGQGWMAGGLDALEQLGLTLKSDNTDGCDISHMHFSSPGQSLTLKTTFLAAENEKSIGVLRDEARREPLCTIVEGKVKSLVKENDVIKGVNYSTNEDNAIKTLRAPLTIIADGKNSQFRHVNCTRKPEISSYNLGFTAPDIKMEMSDACFTGMSDGSLVIAFTRGEPKRTMVIAFSHAAITKKDLLERAEELPEDMRSGYINALQTRRTYNLVAYYMPSSFHFVPGVLTLGDAAHMRDPITASGMTVAMRDAHLWRQLLHDIPDLHDYQAMYAAYNVFAIKRQAYTFVNELLALLFRYLLAPKTEAERTLGAGFLVYVSQSDKAMERVVNLMELRETRPWEFFILVFHIVVNAVNQAVRMESWWTLPRGVYKSVTAVYRICTIIIPHVCIEMRGMVVPWSKPGI